MIGAESGSFIVNMYHFFKVLAFWGLVNILFIPVFILAKKLQSKCLKIVAEKAHSFFHLQIYITSLMEAYLFMCIYAF